jgi:hypothetical protein
MGLNVSRIPTFVTFAGQNTTLPEGVKVPPEKFTLFELLKNVKFEKAKVVVFIIPIFDLEPGTHTKFPDGNKTPPLKFTVPVAIFETVKLVGLYTLTFVVFGMQNTFPFGARVIPVDE